MIQAKPETIWKALTDAASVPRWNSTVTSVEGTIKAGERLVVRVAAAPKRVFKPKVVTFIPNESMTWSEGMAPMFKGVRTFQLAKTTDGTKFTMTEVLKGLALPMAKSALPDFAPIFETYAMDLAREVER